MMQRIHKWTLCIHQRRVCIHSSLVIFIFNGVFIIRNSSVMMKRKRNVLNVPSNSMTKLCVSELHHHHRHRSSSTSSIKSRNNRLLFFIHCKASRDRDTRQTYTYAACMKCKYIILEPTKTNRRNNGINNSIFMSLSTSASSKTMQKKTHDKTKKKSRGKNEPSIYPFSQSASPNGIEKENLSPDRENAKVLQSI